MKIAVEGCSHGELDKIYDTISYIEKSSNVTVDLLLICGDFQAIRNKSDFHCMAVPSKYQKLNTFYKYYSGEKKAPVLTVFIGGNHEASNYMQELPYGGWVAPNIYYMGYSNVLRYGGLRIGGLSGIYKYKDYMRGHHEHPPYTEDTKRSAYHVRNIDVFRLKQISRPLDILMSHDWPRGIWDYGDREALLRQKKFFREEIEKYVLGSPAAEELLYHLKPDYWFSAHLHVKFSALVEHLLDDNSTKETRFLSLDKCLPRRSFLQIIDIPHNSEIPLKLELDPEWLVLLKSTNHLMSVSARKHFMPGPGCTERWNFTVTDEEIDAIKEDFGGNLTIPENFEETVPAHNDNNVAKRNPVPKTMVNSQTTLLCTMLELTDPNAVFLGKQSGFADVALASPRISSTEGESDATTSDNDPDESDSVNTTINSSINTTVSSSLNTTLDSSFNPEEIALDEEYERSGLDDIHENGHNESGGDILASSSSDEKSKPSIKSVIVANIAQATVNVLDNEESELQEILAVQAKTKSDISDHECETNAKILTVDDASRVSKDNNGDGKVDDELRGLVNEQKKSPKTLAISKELDFVTITDDSDKNRAVVDDSKDDKQSVKDNNDDDDDETRTIICAQSVMQYSSCKPVSEQSDDLDPLAERLDISSQDEDKSSIAESDLSDCENKALKHCREDSVSSATSDDCMSKKKFKRRNLSFYTSDETEGEEK